ncbi:DNA-damage-inducible protein F [Methylophaga frappieri]|uniref:DNA-damage-inducible protein F n=2 Tax=Methylophaga frappieri (strain ATCC BAA-2434 / DSM 25690 / JAM7) TaxID=754477 RepID=I1YKZ8_METFJ|nr:DNA-damage-inducible protein F [Methylophaga frappieri]
MILANLSTPVLGLVDTAVVGHLEAAHYLGAVAIGSMIFTLLFWSFGFLRMATTGLTAQASGRRDQFSINTVLVQSCQLACLIAAVILILQWPLREIALWLVPGSDAVMVYASIYFDVRIWAAPATLINYAIIGWLIGCESTRQALLLVLVINAVNILLDVILVYALNMHVAGVALASLIAEYVGLLVGVLIILNPRRYSLDWRQLVRWQSLPVLRPSLIVHGNFMIRTLLLISCFAFFTTQGARQGDTILAANAVLLNFITFMAFVLDGFANATEVLTGKAIGNRSVTHLKQALKLTAFWSALMAVSFTLVYGFAGKQIIDWLTSIELVAAQAKQHLVWVTLAPLAGVLSYLMDGLFVGATFSREMRNTMLFCVLFVYLPAWWVLKGFGNDGLWAALLLFLLARGLSQSAYIARIIAKARAD